NASGRSHSTVPRLPWNSIVLPALRSEARNLMARKGNLCSVRTCRMISPTAPVAPTTATLGTTKGFLSSKSAERAHQDVIVHLGTQLDKGSFFSREGMRQLVPSDDGACFRVG